MQQIYRRTPMPKWDFNKVASSFIRITLRHGCSLKICCIFSVHLLLRTPLDSCFWNYKYKYEDIRLSQQKSILVTKTIVIFQNIKTSYITQTMKYYREKRNRNLLNNMVNTFWLWIKFIFECQTAKAIQKQTSKGVLRKCVLKINSKSSGKYPCQTVISIKF